MLFSIKLEVLKFFFCFIRVSTRTIFGILLEIKLKDNIIFFILTVWEVSTGRCIKSVPCGGVIRSVAWCPNQAISLIAVVADRKVLLINPGIGDRLVTSKTDELLEIIPQSETIGNLVPTIRTPNKIPSVWRRAAQLIDRFIDFF